jgi:hypothetical protein
MDVLAVARKLEPLIAEEVARWLRAREVGNPALKELIDRHILSTGYKKLGDFRRRILLSLPPQEKAKGALHLGTVLYEKEKWLFGISLGELNQHLSIFGRSGAGKTNVAFHLLEQLVARKIPFLFLDWKRTGRHLLPRLPRKLTVYTPGRSLSPFPFNPFVTPPGLEPQVYLQQVVDVLGDAYTFGAGAKSLVQKALSDLYGRGKTSPSVQELLQAVQGLEVKERGAGWKISAVRALESLSYASLSGTDHAGQGELARRLLKGNTILELDALSDASKKFLIPLLCLWLFHVKLAEREREKLNLVILLEEAHHVLHRGTLRPMVMEQLLRQCRELGIGLVVVDQHPSLISQAALGNCFTTICLNLKDPTDINKAAALSLVEDGEKEAFSMLPVGQGIVKMQDRWRRPFLVQFPWVNLDKGAVTDEVLADYLHGSAKAIGSESLAGKALGALAANERTENTLGRIRMPDKGFSEEVVEFLQDIARHRDDGVDARYKRLGISVEKGSRIKNELMASGLVEGHEMKVGRTRKLLLRITVEGRKLLGIGSGQVSRESLAHEYWKQYYARLFEEKGYRVLVEAPRRSGRVDVLAVRSNENATRAPESVAIEIETGKSNVVWNVKQDLLMDWNVLVVATDSETMRKVERELGRVALLIPSRVTVTHAAEETTRR